MPERRSRSHAPATTKADPAEEASQQPDHAGGMTAGASNGATASELAYGSAIQQAALQMNSDRKEKFEEALSNMQDKDGDTGQGIVENLK